MTGRQCTQVESGYFFIALDYFLYEAELAPIGQVGLFDCSCCCLNSFRLSIIVSCVCVCWQGWALDVREHQPGRPASWTGLGFARVSEGGSLEFHISNVPFSMEYDLLIRYESQVCVCVGNLFEFKAAVTKTRCLKQKLSHVDVQDILALVL